MASKRQRAENGQGSIRWINDRQCECVIQSQYLNPKTGKPKRFKRKISIDESKKITRKLQSDIEEQVRHNTILAKEAWEKEIIQGHDIKIHRTKTFGEYMNDYIETIKPNLTGAGYKSYINSLRCNFYNQPIAGYQLQMLNRQVFQNYYDTILSMKAKKTCSVPIQLTKRLCKWLVERSLLSENYAAQATIKQEIADEYDRKRAESLKTKKEIFTSEDIRKFYYAYKNNMSETAPIVMFLLETGMRAGEFAALRLDNINLETRRIDIVEAQSMRYINNDPEQGLARYIKVPKNKKNRFVMMSDLCVEVTKYMIEYTKIKCKNNPNNLLYPTFRTGEPRSISSMEICFKDLCNRLDIDRDVRISKAGHKQGLSLHALRHTMNTIANTAKGANVVNTALAVGHTAIQTSNIYTHASEEALSTITTPSKAILEPYKHSNISEDEMYQMYLMLKEKFEQS